MFEKGKKYVFDKVLYMKYLTIWEMCYDDFLAACPEVSKNHGKEVRVIDENTAEVNGLLVRPEACKLKEGK